VRLFVAVYPPPAAISHLAQRFALSHLGTPREHSLRAVPPERWHLTLVFVGELPDRREPGVRTAIAAATSGVATAPRLRLSGGGRFGRGQFTTVWAGLDGDVAALTELVAAVRHELRRQRIPFDGKAFKPHLTLGRPGDRLTPSELAADLAALDAYRGPDWTVDHIDLVESHLGPHITYDRLASWSVGMAADPAV
jgi:2'-5' RNA ligase